MKRAARVLAVVGAAGIGALLWHGASAPPADAPGHEMPGDAAGWADLGATRLDAGDAAGAAQAFARATRARPGDAALWSGYGEALAMRGAADGVPQDALAAYRRALALDPDEPRARYFLALRRLEDGDAAGAIDDWLALLAGMPGGTPWEADLVRQIGRAGARNGISTASRVAAARARQPGPARRIDPLALPPR